MEKGKAARDVRAPMIKRQTEDGRRWSVMVRGGKRPREMAKDRERRGGQRKPERRDECYRVSPQRCSEMVRGGQRAREMVKDDREKNSGQKCQ